jgi:alpha-N-arabinofuranosidase
VTASIFPLIARAFKECVMQSLRHSVPLAVLMMLWLVGQALTAEGLDRIKNPGFEEKLEGWTMHTYGAMPQVEVDATQPREGKHSLRVSAAEPSDTALEQELRLRPGRCYRFSGWVRTRGLDPHGASVFGTLQVQHAGGRSLLAGGANHGGNTDWTEVPIHFIAPPDGRVRISLFFVGFGKGTGRAWFDDLRLEEVDLSQVPVKVTRDPHCPGSINRFQYGQFVEYLCTLVPGMWAEKLYDGSFEGLSPYKFAYLRDKDFQEKPWCPCGATNRAEHSHDPNNPVSGSVSQKIAVAEGAPCTVGIAQDGIAIERNRACTFTCYLRQQGVTGPVEVRLHHEGTVRASGQLQPTGQWQKYRARLVPTESDTNATLSITFRGPGTLWLDSASLLPEDAVGGWRRDVVEAVRALKPGIIRFGGSALDEPGFGDFDWRGTLGDPDRRMPFRAWGGLQPAAAGLEEMVQFCRHVGAEPLLCVRFTGRTPQDAADQVQYFNGAADSPQGKLRARNGHAEPYRIKYWQVGNERSGKDYEEKVAAFCKAMKEVDPTIQLFSSYPSAGVLRQAGELINYVCPHHYDCANLAATEGNIVATRALLRKDAPDRPIKIAVTEWNTTAGDWGPRRAMLWTLDNALACSRYQNLLHRYCDIVEIANRSNLVNSFCSGIIQTDNHRLYCTPTYYTQQLYATHAGDRPLKIDSAVPANAAPDISATLSRAGDTVILFAINPTLEEITRPLDFSAFGKDGQDVSVWTLADREKAGEPDVTNSFGEPERVRPAQSKHRAAGARFDYRFPPLSLTVLEWRVAQ